ncbi:hypothetical protein ACFLZI_01575 [Nitrospirota bacterium]
MTRLLRIIIFILLSVFIFAGCGGPPTPRTLDAFRTAVGGKSKAISKTETYEVKRAFSKVYKNVKAKGEACLTLRIDKKEKRLLKDKKSHFFYSTVAKKTGKGMGTMALIWGNREYKDEFPTKDVWYMVIVDMKAKGKSRTSVTVSGVYDGNEPYRAIKAYAEGRKHRYCPPNFY